MKERGSFRNTIDFLTGAKSRRYQARLNALGARGVDALASATPRLSGETARSWRYEVKSTPNGVTISWFNDHEVDGTPLAILLQYGHATRNGGFVKGQDYINGAIRPVFEEIAAEVWKTISQ